MTLAYIAMGVTILVVTGLIVFFSKTINKKKQ